MPLLALMFLAIPIIELVVIVYAAQTIGTPQALVLLVVMSLLGAWLVKVEGIGVWRRFQATIARGEIPHREVVDGALIVAAGAFLLTPGFVTDIVGLVFLAPPTRALLRGMILARFRAGQVATVFGAATRSRGTRIHDTDATDVGGADAGPDDPPLPPPGLAR